MDKTQITGECHCGNIRLRFETARDPVQLVPRDCSCGLCRKHRASWVSDPEGEVRVEFQRPEQVSFYRFGHKTADFVLCAHCGVLMLAHCRIDDRSYAVLNRNAMPEGTFAATPITTDFEAEDTPSRLARRKKNWTSNVYVPDISLGESERK